MYFIATNFKRKIKVRTEAICCKRFCLMLLATFRTAIIQKILHTSIVHQYYLRITTTT